eukprot:6227206-Pyramimonas_sp.AAC.1
MCAAPGATRFVRLFDPCERRPSKEGEATLKILDDGNLPTGVKQWPGLVERAWKPCSASPRPGGPRLPLGCG